MPKSKASLLKDRYDALKLIGCIACRVAGQKDCGPTEIHHLNLDGKAGQKRRGNEYTIPLGLWHHRGISYWKCNDAYMYLAFGPSLAKQSKKFRETYGSDNDLLAEVNRRLLQ